MQYYRPGDVICEYAGNVEEFSLQEEFLSFEMYARLNGKEMGINTDCLSNEGRFILGVPSKSDKYNCTFTLF
jgi:hypothetical protein